MRKKVIFLMIASLFTFGASSHSALLGQNTNLNTGNQSTSVVLVSNQGVLDVFHESDFVEIGEPDGKETPTHDLIDESETKRLDTNSYNKLHEKKISDAAFAEAGFDPILTHSKIKLNTKTVDGQKVWTMSTLEFVRSFNNTCDILTEIDSYLGIKHKDGLTYKSLKIKKFKKSVSSSILYKDDTKMQIFVKGKAANVSSVRIISSEEVDINGEMSHMLYNTIIVTLSSDVLQLTNGESIESATLSDALILTDEDIWTKPKNRGVTVDGATYNHKYNNGLWIFDAKPAS